MSSIKTQTLKGFRDFLPQEARKRQYVISALKQVFESYGFEPLETPALEYEEILTGKYGEEGDKLMYRFKDRGKRKVAMRYDQTVPLARVVAQYGSDLPMPFKRYQIQNVWRADNTQKGRFREFLQCDADIVGSSSPLSDAEVIIVAAKSLEKLGFKDFKIIINDRNIFTRTHFKTSSLRHSGNQASPAHPESPINVRDSGQARMTAIIFDKLKKIGKEKVIEKLMKDLNLSLKKAVSLFDFIANQKPTGYLQSLFTLIDKLGIKSSQYTFSPTLARGLDYYTGVIFEIEIEGYSAGSVCGGGRYDNLIGMFAQKQIPAVGFAFGFDRLIEAMDDLNLFPQTIANSPTKVLVTIFSKELIKKSLDIATALSSAGVSTELFLDENASLEKQLKYADKKNIPYAIIIGPEEASKNIVSLRNMKTRQQVATGLKDVLKRINN